MSTRRMCFYLIAACGLQPVAATIPRADQPVSHFFDANGVKLHFKIAGDGEPVLLIHGLHSSAEINWQLPGVIRDLAADHQVIAVDLPGHGRSEKPEEEEAYGLQVLADVLLLLDHLKIKRAHLVGYSLGGMVALKFASQHPDRVHSLLLGGMGWLRDGSALQKVWEKMRRAREAVHLLRLFKASARWPSPRRKSRKSLCPSGLSWVTATRYANFMCSLSSESARTGPSSRSRMPATSTALSSSSSAKKS